MSKTTFIEPSPLSDEPSASPAAERVVVRIAKSGISDILTLPDRSSAAELRQWLRHEGCRVGPLFEPAEGQVAFFSYSRRQARALLAASPTFRIKA